MDENKWLAKSMKLLENIQEEYGVIYINGYFGVIENNNFVLNLLDIKKELGNIIEIISVETKEDFIRLKKDLEKLHTYNFEVSETEFRHRIKTAGVERQDKDDRDRPMTVFEVKVDDYNSINLYEMYDGRVKYVKYQGDEIHNGHTTFSFNQNMTYELIFLNNMYQLKMGKDIKYKKEIIEDLNDVKNKEKALDNLFKDITPEVEVVKEVSVEEEVVINLNKDDFIKKETVNEERILLEDYLVVKIAKHMYGEKWNSQAVLNQVMKDTFIKEFKENNPEEYEELFKTMLIEIVGYVKTLNND